MDKLVLPYDMECMKMAMLKHEETFKQQVHELHRLYQIQRMLMQNMQDQETWNLRNDTIRFEYHNDYTFNKPQKHDPIEENGRLEIEDESEIELTLAPTSYTRRKNNSTLTTQLNLDSMASFSSSSTGSRPRYGDSSRVLCVEEQMRQVDRSLNTPPWLRQVLI
ncbi:hypothetical protein CTI12_AA215130 [Artemisia annua]|uniref:Uncharacterized protein n=1 Tax=Artemisia annua TaxID=35608 RepID=A0A2U1NY68_ARTAN|nr:hypothetical protein CTI12_AA215130 [Artemisia annua]